MIIAVSGWPQSGKDTFSDRLVEAHGFTKLGMNALIRDAAIALNPIVEDRGDGTIMTWSLALETYGYERAKAESDDFRPFMQRLGTEFAEAIGHPEFWVELLLERVDPTVDYVMSSCRRVVEADTIREAGGKIVRVNRPGVELPNDHPVEREMDDYDFDVLLVNGLGIAELHEAVDYTLEIFRL